MLTDHEGGIVRGLSSQLSEIEEALAKPSLNGIVIGAEAYRVVVAGSENRRARVVIYDFGSVRDVKSEDFNPDPSDGLNQNTMEIYRLANAIHGSRHAQS